MMKAAAKQFLGLEPPFCDPATAAVAILPCPYEGGVSYGTGTAAAPDAIIAASPYLEMYDEVLEFEPYRAGIATFAPVDFGTGPEGMVDAVYRAAAELLRMDLFVAALGGDHSITSGTVRAFHERYPTLSVVQIDAHADLRPSYEGSRWSHASVMSRIRDRIDRTLQIGIRSLSVEEADRVRAEDLSLCTMHAYRHGTFDVEAALRRLSDPVFITFDVDALDWSVVQSTGTPEPGGFSWDEAMALLERIFEARQVVGFDVVEMSASPYDRNSPVAVAKLICKMLGFKLRRSLREAGLPPPAAPPLPRGLLHWHA
jgi:agmatinase